ALTGDVVDAAHLDEALESLVVLRDDIVLVGEHALDVDALELGPDAVLLSRLRRLRDLCGVEQRLRRHAAAVEAGASDLVALDEGDAQTERRSAEGGGVSGRAAPQDHKIIVLSRFGHGVLLNLRLALHHAWLRAQSFHYARGFGPLFP